MFENFIFVAILLLFHLCYNILNNSNKLSHKILNRGVNIMEKLTEKQKTVLNFIKSEIKSKGIPPSIREICKATGLSSTSSVHLHLANLEKKGYINRTHSKMRHIEILEDDFYSNKKTSEFENVPIIGTVSAGIQITA